MKAGGKSAGGGASAFLPQVESLRGLAAFCVAFGHCYLALTFASKTSTALYDRLVNDFIVWPSLIVLNGRAAVLVFFVISGLVLSLGLDKAAAHRSVREYAIFAGRRALRIYPAHIVSLALFVPFAWATLFRIPVYDPAALEAARNGLTLWVDGFVYGYINREVLLGTAALWNNYYNPVTWTLKIELLGSLLLPFFALVSRSGRLSRDVAIMAALVLSAAFLIDADKRPDLLPLYLPAFYLGCMARTHGRRLAGSISARRATRTALLLVSLLLLILPTALAPDGRQLFATTMSMSAGGFILVSGVAWKGFPQLDRILLHPLSRAMGRVSYSFYLWHPLVLFAWLRAFFIVVPPATLSAWSLGVFVGTLLVTIPASLAIAALSYRWVERPFVELGRRLGRRSGRKEDAAAAAALSAGGAP